MKSAIQAVRDKTMGTLKAAKTYNVPRSTIQRLAKMTELSPDEAVLKKLGRGTILGSDLEKCLVDYIFQMEEKFYGLTRTDIKRMAFNLTESNELNHPFMQFKKAGRVWLDLFLARHKNTLTLRRPTGTSFTQAASFNRKNVQIFFDHLEKSYDKYNFSSNQVYNVDETGLTIVQNKIAAIVGRKGKRQIASLTSAERGSLITLIACMSAGGNYPTHVSLPKKEYECVTHERYSCNLFTQWFKHFIDTVKPSKEFPVLLILDGHYSHTCNLDVINMARENNIVIISLPPHSTHKLQPLDKTFMGTLKAYYSEEIRQLLHHNNALSQYTILENFLAKHTLKAKLEKLL
ncbi:uncharacterized protein [Diabrotica undecimpunctata]|uniref:uncharacterized protein n=1 Tax=Diabrotica undecimpunctata TaxID=50387 RepID=UPI003B63BD81